MATFSTPSFGFSNNLNLQGLGSPKTSHSISMYQPMPAVGTPSFGGMGRPMTPKESSRHSGYSTKDIEPTIQSMQPSVERTRRHREYYLEGGDIHFLVENYLFRVHRYFFERESPVFRKHFADGALDGNHRIGASDNDPLVLHDVRTDDFSRFLWVFYNPIYSIYDASTEDWAAILGLAHHWQFSEVKSLVVRELEKQIIPSIYKIVIYHRYGVERALLLPSYTDLVSREETLTLEEARDLGLETSLMIMTAREIVRKGEAPTSAAHVPPEELRGIIRQVFRFPGLRSDSPLSDITVSEHMDYRSPPHLAEKTDLSTVPEHENEPITLTTSASLSTPPPVTKSTPPAPLITTPVPPTPTPSLPNDQASSKLTPSTQKKEDAKSASVKPPKEGPPKKEEPVKSTPLSKPKDEPKPNAQESTQPAHGEPSKLEAQDQKKPLFDRLSDASKGAGSPTSTKNAATPKDKDGDKSAANKEAKNTKDTTNAKDAAGPPTPAQDQSGTPVGTPLMNQESDRPGTPSTGLGEENQNTPGQSRRAKKNKGGSGNGSQQQQQGQGHGNSSTKPQSPLTNRSSGTFTNWFSP